MGPGNTLILDNTNGINNNRLPDTGLVVLNNGRLYVKENAATATGETLGSLTLAADTSNSLRVEVNGTVVPGSAITFNGTGTGAGNIPAIVRMEGATLSVTSNTNLVGGQTEIRFANSPALTGLFVGNTAANATTGLGIIPWMTITTPSPLGGNETDFVSDIKGGVTMGASTAAAPIFQFGLGRLGTYRSAQHLGRQHSVQFGPRGHGAIHFEFVRFRRRSTTR